MAFSPDGSRIVSGSMDQTVGLWSASSGVQIVPTLRSHKQRILAVTFSLDGTQVVSDCNGSFIRAWGIKSSARTEQIIITGILC